MTQSSVLISGKHDRPYIAAWLMLAIGVTNVIASVVFTINGERFPTTLYPLAGAIPFLSWFAVSWLRGGTYRLSSTTLSVVRRTGRSWEFALNEVAISIGDKDHLPRVVVTAAGRTVLKLRRVRPRRAAGIIWFTQRFGQFLGTDLLQKIAAEDSPIVSEWVARTSRAASGTSAQRYLSNTLPQIPANAVRTFIKNGKPRFGDFGFMTTHGDRAIYIPNSTTESSRNGAALFGAIFLGFGVFRSLKHADGVVPNLLPIAAFSKAIDESDLDPARAFEIWREVALHSAGTALEQRDQACWTGANDRFEVEVRSATADAR